MNPSQEKFAIRMAGALGGFLIAVAVLDISQDLGRSFMRIQTSMYWAFEGIRDISFFVLQIVFGTLLLCGVQIRAIYWLILGGSLFALVMIGSRLAGAFAWPTGSELDAAIRTSLFVDAAFDIFISLTVIALTILLLRKRYKKQPNQALQATSVTHGVLEKTFVFDGTRRGA